MLEDGDRLPAHFSRVYRQKVKYEQLCLLMSAAMLSSRRLSNSPFEDKMQKIQSSTKWNHWWLPSTWRNTEDDDT